MAGRTATNLHCAPRAYGRVLKLVIAKLDRLARNVAFISNLMESKIDFVAADMPQANRLTVHILAAVAEHEREMISTRTKKALASARSRAWEKARVESIKVRKERAVQFAGWPAAGRTATNLHCAPRGSR